jgi:hypothetical protein
VSASALPVAAPRAGVALQRDVLALGALALCFVGLVAATWGSWGDLDSDTGYDIVAGARIADGELPYRDFVYYYGPLSAALAGLVSVATGGGIGPAVALGLAIAAAVVLATYAVARIVVGSLGAFLAAALTAAVALIPNNYSFVLPHTHAATLGTLLVLLLLLATWRYAGSGRVGWLVTAGACVGLATLTKPEPAAAAVVAASVWLLLRARAGAAWRRELVALATPALTIPAAVYGAFAAATSPRRLLLENLYPVDELEAGGNALVRVRMPMTLDSFATVGGKLLLYAAGVAALALLARALDRNGRWRRPVIAATVAGGAVVLAAAAVKPDGVRDGLYYVYGWIPAGAVLAVVVAIRRFARRAGPWSPAAQLRLAGAIALAVLAATTYGVFVFHGWRPQMAVYYAPLAAILLAYLHLVELPRGRTAYTLGAAWLAFLAAVGFGLTLKDSRAESATVRGPGGALTEAPAEAALYQGALDVIDERTAAGEPLLVAPMMTGLYVLSDRQSPLPEISLLPSALPTAGDETAAIARLEDAGVRLVVTDDREWVGYDQTSFGESFHQRLAEWIDRKFERVATVRSSGERPRALTIWERKT